MKLGNAAEQLEAALVESFIESTCRKTGAVETARTWTLDERGQLVVTSMLIPPLPIKNIVIDFKVL